MKNSLLLSSFFLFLAVSFFAPHIHGSDSIAPESEQVRLDRLELLADIWGTAYIFHPAIVRCDDPLDWQQLLIDTIPAVEQAKSDEELVRILNESLLSHLDDPFTFAYIADSAAPELSESPGTPTGRKLSDSVGYIDVSSPAVLLSPNLVVDLQKTIDDLGSIDMLVLDLRVHDELTMQYISDLFLHMFLDKTVHGRSYLKRAHEGWTEMDRPGAYQQRWEINSGSAMAPIQEQDMITRLVNPGVPFSELKTITIPTAILVNNTLLSLFDHIFDALQTRPHMAIIAEKTGRVWDTPVISKDNIRVNICNAHFLSHRGDIGFRADYTTSEPLQLETIPDLARRILKWKKEPASEPVQSIRFPMCFQPIFEEKNTLSREERIAGLMKMWSVTSCFNLHLDLADTDWETVLTEWIPRVESAETVADYYDVLKQITAPLNDSHVSVTTENFSDSSFAIPVKLSRIENTVVIDKIIQQPESVDPPIQIGDEVTAIDGKSINDILDYWSTRLSASSKAAFFRSALTVAVRGKQDEPTTLTIIQNGQPRDVMMKKSVSRMAWYQDSNDPSYIRKISDDITYINACNIIRGTDLDPVFKDLESAKGLIVDMRGYPQSNLQSEFVPRLTDKPVISTLFEIPILRSPQINFGRIEQSHYTWPPVGNHPFLKPVVVLINEMAVSASEDVCIYMRNLDHVTFVGSRTTGANGNVAAIRLPGGGTFRFTGMRVRFPDGSPFQNIGITPDVLAKPTLQGIRAGKDEVLETGIEVLKKQIQP
jgi:C-terminal processing protease CtpA/Prc